MFLTPLLYANENNFYVSDIKEAWGKSPLIELGKGDQLIQVFIKEDCGFCKQMITEQKIITNNNYKFIFYLEEDDYDFVPISVSSKSQYIGYNKKFWEWLEEQ